MMNRTQAVLYALFHKPLNEAIEALSKGHRVAASAILLRALTTLHMYGAGAESIRARRARPRSLPRVNILEYLDTLSNIQSAAARLHNGEFIFSDAEIMYVMIEFFGRVISTPTDMLQ